MNELKSVKMVQIVALAIPFIARLGEAFKPLIERSEKVFTVPENETEEELGKRLLEGLLLMVDASIIIVQQHAEVVSDPTKKEELMQKAWRIRGFGDHITKAIKTTAEKGTMDLGDMMTMVSEMTKIHAKEVN